MTASIRELLSYRKRCESNNCRAKTASIEDNFGRISARDEMKTWKNPCSDKKTHNVKLHLGFDNCQSRDALRQPQFDEASLHELENHAIDSQDATLRKVSAAGHLRTVVTYRQAAEFPNFSSFYRSGIRLRYDAIRKQPFRFRTRPENWAKPAT